MRKPKESQVVRAALVVDAIILRWFAVSSRPMLHAQTQLQGPLVFVLPNHLLYSEIMAGLAH